MPGRGPPVRRTGAGDNENMGTILYYREEKGEGEYVVLVEGDADKSDIQGHRRPGLVLRDDVHDSAPHV